ncbi:hypothetical protein CO115_03930 [Candidatus Falkowbacteria bacterium CG_4_9_14_3_um_filter_36_9]|nr:MAG: hypothetical protein CO115_03930 [Candidatus Falkowbacteria bacterium CG_4_9_14_3_um_filter_36_9]
MNTELGTTEVEGKGLPSSYSKIKIVHNVLIKLPSLPRPGEEGLNPAFIQEVMANNFQANGVGEVKVPRHFKNAISMPSNNGVVYVNCHFYGFTKEDFVHHRGKRPMAVVSTVVQEKITAQRRKFILIDHYKAKLGTKAILQMKFSPGVDRYGTAIPGTDHMVRFWKIKR